jgi:hypothetical protein
VIAAVASVLLAGCAADEPSERGRPAGAGWSGSVPYAHASGPAGRTAAGRPSDGPRIVVTRHNPALPAGCRPRPLARRIAAFFDAFNRGDPAAARFTDPSRGWYSVTDGRPRRHFVSSTREGLLPYFARRHRHGERLRLEQVDVSYGRGFGHIAYRIDRRADDLRRLGITSTTAHGKGAVDCETGEIVVWSMGMPPGDGHPPMVVCPPPRKPTRAIVACARRGG